MSSDCISDNRLLLPTTDDEDDNDPAIMNYSDHTDHVPEPVSVSDGVNNCHSPPALLEAWSPSPGTHTSCTVSVLCLLLGLLFLPTSRTCQHRTYSTTCILALALTLRNSFTKDSGSSLQHSSMHLRKTLYMYEVIMNTRVHYNNYCMCRTYIMYTHNVTHTCTR